jgi:hypothetical protein
MIRKNNYYQLSAVMTKHLFYHSLLFVMVTTFPAVIPLKKVDSYKKKKKKQKTKREQKRIEHLNANKTLLKHALKL